VGSLADDLAAYTPPLSLEQLIDELDDRDRAELERCLGDPKKYKPKWLSGMLGKNGYDISESQVYRWRQAHGIS
jgi:hypothetical protein